MSFVQVDRIVERFFAKVMRIFFHGPYGSGGRIRPCEAALPTNIVGGAGDAIPTPICKTDLTNIQKYDLFHFLFSYVFFEIALILKKDILPFSEISLLVYAKIPSR